ncbi:hypothetical protein [Palleronia abyssalis]|uniref:DUF1127 domain-containing protein n=1 Tax=Palleronia abyssalis TaxID=1501240 RepID=A0A2R8C1B8_9RHOB|nr:hypothetical protein [Palleronia abyssalis]SPJ26225.1 hypothetical protein PAA8504_04082 [Palleronia abyssalis]
MAFYNSLKSAMAKRAEYRRTRREIESMPLDVALDLDIDRSQSARIARSAVYAA